MVEDPTGSRRIPREFDGGNLTDRSCGVGGAKVDVAENVLPSGVPPKWSY